MDRQVIDWKKNQRDSDMKICYLSPACSNLWWLLACLVLCAHHCPCGPLPSLLCTNISLCLIHFATAFWGTPWQSGYSPHLKIFNFITVCHIRSYTSFCQKGNSHSLQRLGCHYPWGRRGASFNLPEASWPQFSWSRVVVVKLLFFLMIF